MKVSFYGHTRQYHNIKSEIDANISEVLESGSYVLGPMGKKFEAQAAEYFGCKHAIGVGIGRDDSGSARYRLLAMVSSTSSDKIFLMQGSSAISAMTNSAPFTPANADTITYDVKYFID